MADWTLGTDRETHLAEHNQFDHTDLASLTEGRVLGVSGGYIKQIDVLSRASVVLASTYELVSGDAVILVDTTNTAITITLPDLATMDLESVIIKRIAGINNVTIVRSGSDQINTDGTLSSTRTLESVGASWSATGVDSDSRWYTIGEHGTVT